MDGQGRTGWKWELTIMNVLDTLVKCIHIMRPLTEEETKTFFEKLSKYIGKNITYLVDRPDEPYCFRMNRDRVYYVSERVLKRAECIPRDNLVSLGVCFGKFTKSGKFRLHVTCLDHLAQYCRFKVWVKPTSEMSYMYGNHVLKAHVAKISEEAPEHEGIVVFSQTNDLPIGFAVTAKSAAASSKLDPIAIIAFHQADIGEYLRSEETLI